MVTDKENKIILDICRVAELLGKKKGDRFSRYEYLNNLGRFSHYDLYDGGTSWDYYCKKAGYKTKAKELCDDDYYFEKLQSFIDIHKRFPKTSERNKSGLNFAKKRWPTLKAFIEDAIARMKITIPDALKPKKELKKDLKKQKPAPIPVVPAIISKSPRPIPPIPVASKRKKWERTGMEGFPYTPHDESGVVALFAILCAKGVMPWQILELNSGKGIDGICYDDNNSCEIRVELKYILSRTGWNHSFDSFDVLVCWENRWQDFPKPVIELKEKIKRLAGQL